MAKNKKIEVEGKEITIILDKEQEYISLTDMLKAKDGDFFISDWLRNRNTVEYLGIWESVYNPTFNYGEFATIKSQAGLNKNRPNIQSGEIAERLAIPAPTVKRILSELLNKGLIEKQGNGRNVSYTIK
ncbi:MAG TPA: KilA-N domain-containing protein [Taishania sp.]|nr:KilA-N domain-containing protein [Taishania sp.]HNS41671.1 KilA-N domain-containing protein [Taishania sp.]